jgi:hypothetical protein
MSLKLSISDVSTFLECRRRWTFHSRNAMGLEPSQPSRALLLGTAVHEGLAAYYKGLQDGLSPVQSGFTGMFTKSWGEQLSSYGIPQIRMKNADGVFDDLQTELTETKALGLGMLAQYAQWAPKHDAGWKVLAVEYPFEIPIDFSGTTFSGVIDLVVQDAIGRLWVVDHKTYTSSPDPVLMSMDLQSLAYEWAIAEMNVLGTQGAEFAGTVFNVLKKSDARICGGNVSEPLSDFQLRACVIDDDQAERRFAGACQRRPDTPLCVEQAFVHGDNHIYLNRLEGLGGV